MPSGSKALGSKKGIRSTRRRSCHPNQMTDNDKNGFGCRNAKNVLVQTRVLKVQAGKNGEIRGLNKPLPARSRPVLRPPGSAQR